MDLEWVGACGSTRSRGCDSGIQDFLSTYELCSDEPCKGARIASSEISVGHTRAFGSTTRPLPDRLANNIRGMARKEDVEEKIDEDKAMDEDVEEKPDFYHLNIGGARQGHCHPAVKGEQDWK